MSSREPDVWQMIFEQTPTVLRWLLGVLSLGLFTLAGIIYKWNKRDTDQLRKDIKQVGDRVDRLYDLMLEHNRQ